MNTNAELQELLRQIAAEEERVRHYEAEYREDLAKMAEDPDAAEWLSALQFTWLYTKYEYCWYEDARVEAALLGLRSDAMLFTPTDFEQLIQALLGIVTGKHFKATSVSHDEGVDLLDRERVTPEWEIEAWATTVVQCKLYRGYIPVTDVRDFFGVMVSRTATGLFFTTGKLTSQGKRFLPTANSSSMANRFHLIARDELASLLETCERLADVITGEEQVANSLLDRRVASLRKEAAAVIYAARKPKPPSQGSLW